VLCHLQDRVDRLLLRGVDESAGVDDENIRRRAIGGDLVAGLFGQAQHDLAVDEVLGAPEGKETDLHC
jgi:hypothetical protein